MELLQAVQTQLKSEIEEEELSKPEYDILAQKYGLVAPKLTASEKHLILKEERKNGIHAN